MIQKNAAILYKKLIEHMNEAVWMGDSKEKTIYANPKFCELLGYTLDEVIGQESYIFWDEESQKRVRSTNQHKRRKGISSTYEGNLITKDGEKIPVLLSGTPLHDGGTIGIMTDLRPLKEKERNENILYNAVQYSTDAIMTVDENGTITSWNSGAQMIFGHRNEKIVGKPLDKIFFKKDIPSILQKSDMINKYQLVGKHENKSRIAVSITQTPLENSTQKESFGYLIIGRDITDHRKIEEDMELKYNKIREVYKEIGIIKRQSDYIFDLIDMFENYYFDLEKIGDFIVTSIIMLTKVDGCELRLYDTENDKLDMVSYFGFSQDWAGKRKIFFKGSLAEQAYNNGAPMKIIDLRKEPLYQTAALAKKHNMTSLLLLPLVAKGEFIGLLSLYTKADKKLEIFDNEFIEKYAKIIQIILRK